MRAACSGCARRSSARIRRRRCPGISYRGHCLPGSEYTRDPAAHTCVSDVQFDACYPPTRNWNRPGTVMACAAEGSTPVRPLRDRRSLGCFRLGDEPLVDPLLEAPPKIFTGHSGNGARATGLDLHRDDGRVVVAVATGVTLGFRQRSEAPHEPRLGPTSDVRGRARRARSRSRPMPSGSRRRRRGAPRARRAAPA